ncbi:MAG: dTMP kinase [Promethearchaeota archaeon]|nr:MAG: dTMP kinase [Candidatus Lokiarchaeota archaeon]
MMTMKPLFIVIGGIDGSGGTSHTKLLFEWLKKKLNSEDDIILTMEPTDGRIGKLAREYLKNINSDSKIDALLFAADRLEHNYKTIIPAYTAGKIIISDRYLESSLAYQEAQGLKLDWLLEINKEIIIPDLIIILDITPSKSLKRKQKMDDKFENVEFLLKVRENYLRHAKKWDYKIINSDRKIDEVQNDIRNLVESLLEK